MFLFFVVEPGQGRLSQAGSYLLEVVYELVQACCLRSVHRPRDQRLFPGRDL